MSKHCILLTLLILALACLSGCAGRNRSSAADGRVNQYLDQADTFLEEGLLDSALASFGMALEENPRLVDAQMGMADIYRGRGNYEVASHLYQLAADTDPTNFDANYWLGVCKQMLGQFHEAIAAYLRARAIRPDSPETNRDLASAYLQVGRPGEALPYAQQAVQLNPDEQKAWYNLAATHGLLGQYEEAVDAYRQAAELGELADPVLLGLADAHLHLGNYQRAVNVLDTLIRKAPTATAHERLAFAQFKLRQFDQALVNYRKAVELSPTEVAALNGVGASLMTQYLQGGRADKQVRDQAIAAWRESLRVQPAQDRIIDLLSRYSRL
jgi:tetratricopeptide (TPR) repeat protein